MRMNIRKINGILVLRIHSKLDWIGSGVIISITFISELK